MSEKNSICVLAEKLGNALSVFNDKINSNETFSGFMLETGWDIFEIPQPIKDLSSSIQDIIDTLESGEIDVSNLGSYLGKISAFMNAVEDIKNKPDSSFPSYIDVTAFKNEFATTVIDYLVMNYINDNHPKWGRIFWLIGLFRITYTAAASGRPAYLKRTIHWEYFSEVINNPIPLLKNYFKWGTSDFDTNLFMETILELGAGFNLDLRLEKLDDNIYSFFTSDATDSNIPNRAIKYALYQDTISDVNIESGILLFLLPETSSGKPGFAILPYVNGTSPVSFEIAENVTLTLDADFDLSAGAGIVIRAESATEFYTGIIPSVESGTDPPSSRTFSLSITDQSGTDAPIILFGSAEGSRFEVQSLSLELGIKETASGNLDIYAETKLNGGKIVIKPGSSESDSFISSLLPSDGSGIDVDLTAGISTEQGFYFIGGGGLELQFPIHVEAGPIEIQSATLSVKADNNSLPVELGIDFKTEIGPLSGMVRGIGLTAGFNFPGKGGNLGPLDVDLSFKPPTGIAVSIDSSGFSGGGFLFFDDEKKEYSGGLELEFQDTISIKAIGILTTLMPDGTNGFSLLIIITAEFTPIQLGFGFTLNGVGGLIGINRTCEIDVLQSGVKDGTLDNILFPEDIVANAVQIVSDVKKVFPVLENQYVFGPMAEFGWGTPTLITVQLGLLIEIPNPVRLAILGVLKTLLPDENFKLLSLQVNFLGVIDFENCSLSFDASIYDSKLLTFTLTGDMALRLNWGSDPVFVLSVGGFHPSYDPPANLGISNMERLSISLFPGNNPKLTIETYFAVTSNTVQFGAKGELYVGVSKFDVEGNIGFDVLFQFSPFYFVAQCYANLSVSAFNKEILSVSLFLNLDGPTPWHANGTASFKVIFKVEVNVNETFGDNKNTTLQPIDIKPLLEDEFSKTGNWRADIPDESNLQVTLRTIEQSDDLIIIHPFGILNISQKLVPLDLTISKFGNQSLEGDNNFSISKVEIGSDSIGFNDTQEEFAPGQFFNLSDAEKLSNKDFENYNSGVSMEGTAELKADYVVEREVEYEIEYLHRERTYKFIKVHGDIFSQMLRGNAINRSVLSSAVNSPSVLGTQKVSVSSEKFTITNINDMAIYNEEYVFTSEREAKVKMEEIFNQNPSLKNELQVMPAYGVSV